MPAPAMPPEPYDLIHTGFFSDQYFQRAREILHQLGCHPTVTMQIFAREPAVVCGVRAVLRILRECAERPEALTVRGLADGDRIEPWETIMHVEGDYASFAHLETVYLGILARMTRIATATRDVVDAATGRPVLFFGARFDHYAVQGTDGEAAKVGGAHAAASDAAARAWGTPGVGTIPHALIAACGGDTVAATKAFDEVMPPEVPRVALVDFHNDCVRDSLAVARALGKRLWGVRLDTAGGLRDVSVVGTGPEAYGVSAELVHNVRRALDAEGFKNIKIVVSGGFTPEKVAEFVRDGVPFDAVGVGSTLFKRRIDFTADIVRLNGEPCAKVGREYKPNPRMRQLWPS